MTIVASDSDRLIQMLEEVRLGRRSDARGELAVPEFGEGENASDQLREWLHSKIICKPLVTSMHQMVAEFVCRYFLLSESGLKPLRPSLFSAAALVCAVIRDSPSTHQIQTACMKFMDSHGCQDAADILFIHLLLMPLFRQPPSDERIDTNWELIQRSPLTRLIYLDRLVDNRRTGGGLRALLFRDLGPKRQPGLEWSSLKLLTERNDFSAFQPMLQWFLDALHRMTAPEQQSLKIAAMERLADALELHLRVPGLPRSPKPHHLEEFLIQYSDA